MKNRALFILLILSVSALIPGFCLGQIVVENAKLVKDLNLSAPATLPQISDRITVEGATGIINFGMVYPGDVITASLSAKNRMILEYATAIYDLSLTYPNSVAAAAASARDRMIVEYATGVVDKPLLYPSSVVAVAATARPRIAVEYATGIKTLSLTPFNPTDTDKDGIPDSWERVKYPRP
jgi:hypothetical protein